MDPITLAAVVAGLAVLLLVAVVSTVVVALLRRPTQAEVEALLAASRAVEEGCTAALDHLGHLETRGRVEQVAAAASHAVEQHLRDYESDVSDRITDAVDGDLFVSGLKAKLPKKSWQEDYRRRLDSIGDRVLQPRTVQRELREIVTSHTADLLEEVETKQRTRVPREALDTLEQLQLRPLRMQAFLEERESLESSLDRLAAARNEGLAIGGMIAAGGVGLAGAAALLPPSHLMWVAGQLAGLKWTGADKLVEFITELIIEEVGEEAISEALEAVGAALTGVGLLFAGWKAIKYGWLAKRLLADQVHIVGMRERLEEAWLTEVQKLRGRAPTEARHAVLHATRRFRENASALRREAREQIEWAEERLPEAA